MAPLLAVGTYGPDLQVTGRPAPPLAFSALAGKLICAPPVPHMCPNGCPSLPRLDCQVREFAAAEGLHRVLYERDLEVRATLVSLGAGTCV